MPEVRGWRMTQPQLHLDRRRDPQFGPRQQLTLPPPRSQSSVRKATALLPASNEWMIAGSRDRRFNCSEFAAATIHRLRRNSKAASPIWGRQDGGARISRTQAADCHGDCLGFWPKTHDPLAMGCP
jgi:hypothetical protein